MDKSVGIMGEDAGEVDRTCTRQKEAIEVTRYLTSSALAGQLQGGREC